MPTALPPAAGSPGHFDGAECACSHTGGGPANRQLNHLSFRALPAGSIKRWGLPGTHRNINSNLTQGAHMQLNGPREGGNLSDLEASALSRLI